MRAPPPPCDIAAIAALFEAAPGIARVRSLTASYGAATPETVEAILSEAVLFAENHLVQLNDAADAQGCRITDGRVETVPGHRAAWDAFVAGGWSTLDHPEAIGGQGLPLSLAMAMQEVFDRACPAFGMLPVPQRSAVRLIAAHADPALQAEWLPPLVAGAWGATICISEPEAGSDVGRIRTRAEPLKDGSWAITGEKCWISFGDHDLAPRIGHCLLARTPGAAPRGRGLSLFLVPDHIEGVRNGVTLRRIEHKMGLHGSPTCALGFEGAVGRLIGTEGRGLTQLFVMITNMRLAVGVQGLGIASAAADTALAYARERRQGGTEALPVPISEHVDVQRQLLGAAARVATLRGLILAAANYADIAAYEPEPGARAEAAALILWLLPIVKTTGGEFAQEAADAAIQVLGASGYTKEWPVEQAARDARVLTIYEGTTGIQALDLLHRRLVQGEGKGLAIFLRLARAETTAAQEAGVDGGKMSGLAAGRLAACLDTLDRTAADLRAAVAAGQPVDAGATAFLHLATLAATGWIAIRLLSGTADAPAICRPRAAADYWLCDIDARAALLGAQSLLGVGTPPCFDIPSCFAELL